MDVELYVYDLSRGLARQMSLGFLGVHIDAVYHTSLVFGGIEYFFGAGVQTCYPGTTHHGQPMQKIKLGRTELELDVILEYLDSLKQIYTPESYDLFMHNCNNFSNDFAMFLVGRGIPDHITSLPQTVLDTPFGQMLKPQLDQAMRGITQAPVDPPRDRWQKAATNGVPAGINGTGVVERKNTVHNVTQIAELDALLSQAKSSCAVIFFTSSTCAPCKICYKPYDDLAGAFENKATLIKVDINSARNIASRYQIRATPTFITLLQGEKFEEWAGADPRKLVANVQKLVQMAHPPHPHMSMRLPTLQRRYEKPDLYTSMPPLEKLVTKLGPSGQAAEIQALKDFVRTRAKEEAANATLPDLKAISSFVKRQIKTGQTDSTFALIDLLRIVMVDPRASGVFAEESQQDSCVQTIIDSVCDWESNAMISTKMVTVQLACNLFSSHLWTRKLGTDESVKASLLRLCTWLLLDESRLDVRQGAITLALNITKPLHLARLEAKDEAGLPESVQVELAACLIESIQRETNPDTLKRMLLALGLLAYGCARDGELRELFVGMDTAESLESVASVLGSDRSLLDEVVKVVV